MRRLIEQIKRFFYWGWKLRNSFDWDNGFLEEMILLKLKRMRACFNSEDYKHNRWSLKEEIQQPQIEFKQGLIEQYKADVAMDICIMILERRMDSDFYDRISGLDEFSKDFTYNFDNGEFNSLYKGQPVPKEVAKKRNELVFKGDEIKTRDKKLLYYLMEKFSESWWS